MYPGYKWGANLWCNAAKSSNRKKKTTCAVRKYSGNSPTGGDGFFFCFTAPNGTRGTIALRKKTLFVHYFSTWNNCSKKTLSNPHCLFPVSMHGISPFSHLLGTAHFTSAEGKEEATAAAFEQNFTWRPFKGEEERAASNPCILFETLESPPPPSLLRLDSRKREMDRAKYEAAENTW